MDTPLEKRVCWLYFGGDLRPQVRDAPGKLLYGLSPEQLADVVADIGTDMWEVLEAHSDGEMHYKSQMVAQSRSPSSEYFGRIVARSHQHGIWVLGGEQLSQPEIAVPEAKEWMIHPIAYSGEKPQPSPKWLSFACPGFEDWMSRFMVEHVTIADLDGIHFDGTPFAQRIGWPWPAGDIGPCGAKSFKEKTGQEPPQKEDWSSQVFREWVRWRYDTTVRFFQAVSTATVKAKPHAAIAMIYNMHNVDWQLGLPLRNVAGQNWYPSIHDETSLLGRIGRALSPRSEEWFWAQWHMPQIVHGESPYFDPDKTIAMSLRALAHGVYPSIGGFAADIELWKDGMKKVFTELAKRREYVGGESVKHAAIVVSQQTRDYRRDLTHFWHAVEGFNELQDYANILTDVIFDDSLTPEGLSPYPVVILPQVACLSDAQCEALRQYVRQGGTLIATTDSSLYDEWGKRRQNFALADLFGVDYAGDGQETQILVPQTPQLRKQFGRFVSFLAPSRRVTLRKDGGAEVLFTRSRQDNLNGVSVEFDQYDSDTPVIVRRREGKGSAIYVAAGVGQGYLGSRVPQLARMVAALERLNGPGPITADESSAVETTAYWRGKDQMIVHLVNCTAMAFQTMTPLGEFGITVNGRELKSATSPVTGRTLEVRDNRVVVPSIGYGDVLVLELK